MGEVSDWRNSSEAKTDPILKRLVEISDIPMSSREGMLLSEIASLHGRLEVLTDAYLSLRERVDSIEGRERRLKDECQKMLDEMQKPRRT